MSRLALFNMTLGFTVLFFAAAAGAFIATDLTEGYLRDKAILESWRLVLASSAHGHSNLFATIHICFGLTLPYSALPSRVKLLQTIGLAAGTFAMGPVMIVRSLTPPAEGIDIVALVIGALLSCSLAAIGAHAFGLAMKLTKRS